MQKAASFFPKLILKHFDEIKSDQDSEILQHKQLHEIYMFQFFKLCPLDSVSPVAINNVNGSILSPIRVKSFTLRKKVTENEFFDALLKSPIPFVFVPQGISISLLDKFCNGGYSYKEGEREGILMNLKFASEVGIEFVGSSALERRGVECIFIGIEWAN